MSRMLPVFYPISCSDTMIRSLRLPRGLFVFLLPYHGISVYNRFNIYLSEQQKPCGILRNDGVLRAVVYGYRVPFLVCRLSGTGKVSFAMPSGIYVCICREPAVSFGKIQWNIHSDYLSGNVFFYPLWLNTSDWIWDKLMRNGVMGNDQF